MPIVSRLWNHGVHDEYKTNIGQENKGGMGFIGRVHCMQKFMKTH